MIFYKTNLFYKIIPLTKKKKKTVTFAHIISRNRRQFPNSNLQLIKRSKRSNPNDSPKRVISSKVITIANIFTMLLQRRGEEGWKQTGRERSHLVEGELFTVPLSWEIYRGRRIDRTTTRRRTVKRETNESFDSTMQNSTTEEWEDRRGIRYYQRMRILGSLLSLSLSWNSWTVAKNSGWLPPVISLSPPPYNGRFYLQLTESRCFASRRRESEGEIRGEISSPLCDGTWIFISVPGCGLFRTPGVRVFQEEIGKNRGGL